MPENKLVDIYGKMLLINSHAKMIKEMQPVDDCSFTMKGSYNDENIELLSVQVESAGWKSEDHDNSFIVITNYCSIKIYKD